MSDAIVNEGASGATTHRANDTPSELRPSGFPGSGGADYTKTRTYVALDLGARVLSAVALAVLGIAGWLLQANNEQARRQREAFDREERKYLPAFRSLTELELLLTDAAQIVPERSAKNETYPGGPLGQLGSQLHYAALSLVIPGDDPLVCVQPPGGGEFGKPCRELPLQSGVVMLGEFLQALPVLRSGLLDAEGSDITVKVEPRIRCLKLDAPKAPRSLVIPISAASLPAWTAWLPEPTPLHTVMVDADALPHDFRRATSEYLQKLVLEHSNLGAEYVTIRSDAIRSHRPFIPVVRPGDQP